MSVYQLTVRRCPRCGYRGEGLPYFGRGLHVFLLICFTVLTSWALGVGGLIHYLLRREHLACARCGQTWGRFGVEAREAVSSVRARASAEDSISPLGRRGTGRRTAAVALLVGAGLLLSAGLVGGDAMALGMSAIAAIAATACYRSANRARDLHRRALLSGLQRDALRLARERHGTLTVSELAASLGWTLRRADKVLASMEDGFRVRSDVTDDGRIVYEFPELVKGRR